MKGKRLSELSWREAAEIMKKDPIVVLPIGGGVKEHGPHLPLGTDMYVVNELTERVLLEAEVLMLPPLNYAYFPAFIDWPGSVSIAADTFKGFVSDIIRSYARHGVRKFLILDGGVSTQFPLAIVSSDLHNELGIEVAVTDIRGLGAETARSVCESSKGGHADESETSCLLSIRADLVRMGEARSESSSSPYTTTGPTGIPKITLRGKMQGVHGVNGDPTRATAAKGCEILGAMAKDILVFLESFKRADHA